MKQTLVQSKIEYQSLADDVFLTIVHVFGADAVSRLYDQPLADVEKRSRLLEKAAREQADKRRSDRKRVGALLNRPDKHILEVCHEQCDFIRDVVISKVGSSIKSCADTLKTLREIAGTQKDINDALSEYLNTKAAIDAIVAPVAALPPEYADAVLSAWADNPELRLLMR